MNERTYISDGIEHSISIGKTTFVVNSFTDSTATNSAEELIVKLLKSKVAEIMREEKTA
ncbi:MAG: hypothetical protein IJ007_07695 [Oscillospiraceae bacterium]|nr:hypothetical protein [Oscillospiraceae bacterium]